jgi:hypothetical protein
MSAIEGALLYFEDATEYRNIVDGFQYLTITQYDISFAVNQVYRYLHAPQDTHWYVVKHPTLCSPYFIIWSASSLRSFCHAFSYLGCIMGWKS